MNKNVKDGIRRFDFEKKPISPCFLMTLAKWIISWPDLKKRGFKLTRTNMDGVEGPYLLLVTHSSMVDFNIMLKATHPHPINNVMTLEGFHTYTEPLMRSLGVLGTRKFINDMHLIKNIRYCITKLKNIFVLFPEARYSLDGCTSYLPESVGKLVRILGVPVVVLRIHGNFVTCPQWNKINKKTYVEAEVKQILTPEDTKRLSVSEINARIQESFQYDDFRWQLENKLTITHPERAKGLHALLYKCPACGCEHETDSKGTLLWCNHCGKQWEMDEYGQLHALQGETEFSHIPDWSNWERECVRKEIEDGTYYFEDQVRVETLPSSMRFYKQGKGRLIQTPSETRLECTCYGKPYTLVRSAMHLESMHIEYDYLGRGDCVDISIPDDSFWCYLSKRDAITKISFATEEMHKLAKREGARA
ncbi:MAG: hypothetical protein IJ036_04220 [Lachnospiraceae bacterium]|nr:hypothetical protein [Lachnospiraceae bacterium]